LKQAIKQKFLFFNYSRLKVKIFQKFLMDWSTGLQVHRFNKISLAAVDRLFGGGQ
jgi:hypothetical protein